MTTRHISTFGIPGLGVVPYGLHMCHFFPAREELIDGLVPYFEAGVDNHERCIWVTSFPLPAQDALSEIAKSKKLRLAVTSGQLRVFDAVEWFGEAGAFDIEGAIQDWLEEEQSALADGFQGLRITGNTSFIARENWNHLIEYESKFHDRMKDRRIIACCNYHREQCGSVEILEAVRCHHGSLDRTDDHWDLLLEDSHEGVQNR
ncbi:MAG TPA: MEDS domain-containing protein [Candidatus Sulfotelmatobacter sp.]|jgi:hypothetical protein|nr:MEDS domain-containing protein [Candidatus Sulfotelmatobacter sp.]